MKDIRFILDSHDDAFENEIKTRLSPYCDEIVSVEEHGDAGTTITIICVITQTLLEIPACILAIKQLIEWKNAQDKSQKKEDKKEITNTEEVKLNEQPKNETTTQPWTMVVDGHPFDFSGLPSDYERILAFNSAREAFPYLFGNSPDKLGEE